MFVRFASPAKNSSLAVVDDDVYELERVTCPLNPGHQRAGARTSALRAKVNGPAGDIVWTWQGDCLLSEQVIEAIDSAGLSGASYRPAEVLDRRGTPIARRYKELVVTGWAGFADVASGVRLIESCPGCGLLVYSCFTNPTELIDESQWDRSDFFLVWPLPRFIFVTQKAASTLVGHAFGPMRLIPVNELRCRSQLTPGRLSYWMPADRARILGGPLHID